MVDLIIVAIILAIVGAAVFYIVKSKRSGAKCIGCPSGGQCAHKGTSACSCHTKSK